MMLTQHEGLFSMIIDHFPYPIALFDRNGVLIMANQSLLQGAGLKSGEIEGKKINFSDATAPDNVTLLKASVDVFNGETTLVRNLWNPFAMFHGEERGSYQMDGEQTAVIFPVFTDSGSVSHGAVMFMK